MAHIFGSIWDRFNRNALNVLSKSVEHQGKSIQDLVAEGQLTPTQYATLIQSVNGLISKGDVSVLDIDKNQGKFDSTYFSSDFLEDLNNGIINSTEVLPGSITSKELSKKAVKPENTNFATASKNIYNKDDVIQDRILSGENLVVNVNFVTSDFIEVTSSTTYKRSHNAVVAMYNENKVWLRAESNNSESFVTSPGTFYIRVSTLKSTNDILQIELGNNTTSYEEHGILKMDKLKVQESNLVGEVGRKINDPLENNFQSNVLINPENQSMPIGIFNLINEYDTFTNLNSLVRKDYGKTFGFNPYGWNTDIREGTNNITSTFHKTKKGISAINLVVYVEEPEKISSMLLRIRNTEEYNWMRPVDISKIKKGVNVFRFKSTAGNIADWYDFYGLRLQVIATSSSNITIMGIFGEVPEKAQLLFVEDGGYVEFIENGYPSLKERGIPTTWALNPGRLGSGRIITEADVDNLSMDFMSAFSYHSWASEVHSTMTYRQVQDNAIRCERWLQKKGIQPKYPFRAAITQNNVTHHEGLQDIVEAYSSYSGASSYETYPFENPYGFARISVHGVSSDERMEEIFDVMKKTHCLVVFYTHGVGPRVTDGLQAGEDASYAHWSRFLENIDRGIDEGWLEGVTYDILRTRFNKIQGGNDYERVIQSARGK